jgi:hypothetical protein
MPFSNVPVQPEDTDGRDKNLVEQDTNPLQGKFPQVMQAIKSKITLARLQNVLSLLATDPAQGTISMVKIIDEIANELQSTEAKKELMNLYLYTLSQAKTSFAPEDLHLLSISISEKFRNGIFHTYKSDLGKNAERAYLANLYASDNPELIKEFLQQYLEIRPRDMMAKLSEYMTAAQESEAHQLYAMLVLTTSTTGRPFYELPENKTDSLQKYLGTMIFSLASLEKQAQFLRMFSIFKSGNLGQGYIVKSTLLTVMNEVIRSSRDKKKPITEGISTGADSEIRLIEQELNLIIEQEHGRYVSDWQREFAFDAIEFLLNVQGEFITVDKSALIEWLESIIDSSNPKSVEVQRAMALKDRAEKNRFFRKNEEILGSARHGLENGLRNIRDELKFRFNRFQHSDALARLNQTIDEQMWQFKYRGRRQVSRLVRDVGSFGVEASVRAVIPGILVSGLLAFAITFYSANVNNDQNAKRLIRKFYSVLSGDNYLPIFNPEVTEGGHIASYKKIDYKLKQQIDDDTLYNMIVSGQPTVGLIDTLTIDGINFHFGLALDTNNLVFVSEDGTKEVKLYATGHEWMMSNMHDVKSLDPNQPPIEIQKKEIYKLYGQKFFVNGRDDVYFLDKFADQTTADTVMAYLADKYHTFVIKDLSQLHLLQTPERMNGTLFGYERNGNVIGLTAEYEGDKAGAFMILGADDVVNLADITEEAPADWKLDIGFSDVPNPLAKLGDETEFAKTAKILLDRQVGLHMNMNVADQNDKLPGDTYFQLDRMGKLLDMGLKNITLDFLNKSRQLAVYQDSDQFFNTTENAFTRMKLKNGKDLWIARVNGKILSLSPDCNLDSINFGQNSNLLTVFGPKGSIIEVIYTDGKEFKAITPEQINELNNQEGVIVVEGPSTPQTISYKGRNYNFKETLDNEPVLLEYSLSMTEEEVLSDTKVLKDLDQSIVVQVYTLGSKNILLVAEEAEEVPEVWNLNEIYDYQGIIFELREDARGNVRIYLQSGAERINRDLAKQILGGEKIKVHTEDKAKEIPFTSVEIVFDNVENAIQYATSTGIPAFVMTSDMDFFSIKAGESIDGKWAEITIDDHLSETIQDKGFEFVLNQITAGLLNAGVEQKNIKVHLSGELISSLSSENIKSLVASGAREFAVDLNSDTLGNLANLKKLHDLKTPNQELNVKIPEGGLKGADPGTYKELKDGDTKGRGFRITLNGVEIHAGDHLFASGALRSITLAIPTSK